ncbi:hypothetical protein A3I99_03045 [Candidatus Kaiserbacteria bacterium RIFCSPLOWO2_02_FULL_45_11b]|uniref:Bacterial Ig-like domain-containing protein n=1 Tax=Candidatus Kaiserbacteria bacterium RIFCSPLOWO2_12_FULL_45_26 TaxID=1798525 RepID=A0A1F6FGQ2_9BACT|nr:MAG: hypothetical protein A2929_02110 [Candidatus Kaiserbacteria bacterium RIFCSPLOWO2_01_FULL_45_25]OGG81728.1 MAG: hypothetical protein A3I99_03045 [Candidatus Kaiserbacteria bacterium RIFCSPLOWO2_02_FULL_45_11b]OGG85025.1 MAG: hypothetical protein A3G90_03100 [Candidatus Kaiserbacteria bacterium RIFCSPLOWO2_12_FULL_45_26]
MTLKLNTILVGVFLIFFLAPLTSLAATLSLSPSTGVYTTGSTFTVRAVVNTQGKPVNAAEGTIKFNPAEVTVVSVNRSGSIFNLWVTEPTFSNSAGTISFSGGMPSGYTGSAGTIFSITFKTTNASAAKVNFTNGSVLANDGMGTNVLSSMNGGSYTISAASVTPTPEVVEYVAPANTPGAPVIESSTHPNSEGWYTSKTATLSWNLPAGVTEVRTLLDDNANSIPTRVYEDPISTITIEDLDEGVQYFHLQFRNEDGWGKVSHYRLAVDTEKPTKFDIALAEDADGANPAQTLLLTAEDAASKIARYVVKIDNSDAYDFIDSEDTDRLVLPQLTPGYHSVIIEAVDEAGNGLISSFSFTIESFDKPVFTEYPSEINEEVIPVFRGLTRANAAVEVTIQKIGAEPVVYSVTADEAGVFTVIPSGTFSLGVYELTARATDTFGAQSEPSDTIKIAVQQPGYIQIGSFLVNILSVIIPLVAMTLLLVLASWFMLLYLRRFRSKVRVESHEAVAIVFKEFASLRAVLAEKQLALSESRKTKKLTKAEENTFATLNEALQAAENNIQKEVGDVEGLVDKK